MDANTITNITFDRISSISTAIAALAAILMAIFTYKLLSQLKFTKEQIRFSSQWNKLNATFSFFPLAKFHECHKRTATALKKYINLYTLNSPISEEMARKIFDDNEAYEELGNYIDLFEEYSTAVNAGVLDKDCSYRLHGALLPSVQKHFQPFINLIREKKNDETIFIEIEKLSLEWQERIQSEASKEKK